MKRIVISATVLSLVFSLCSCAGGMVSADEARRPGSDEKLTDEQIAMEETAEPADDQAEYSNGDESITDDVLIDDTARLFNPIKTIDIVYTHYDGESYSSERLEYDIDGHLINSIRYKPNSAGEIDYALAAEYDGEGLLISETEIRDSQTTGYSVCEYDDAGNMIREIWYSPEGTENNWFSYEYDNLGEVIRKYLYAGDECLYWNEYTYDEYGNLISDYSYHSDELQGWTTFRYDNENMLIEESRYNTDGALTRKYIYEYNECGDVSMETAYDSDGSLVSGNVYEYDYDVAGHIVKKYVMLQDQNYNWYDYVYSFWDSEG